MGPRRFFIDLNIAGTVEDLCRQMKKSGGMENDMEERLFDLILTLIPVIGAIITCFVVPYLKAALGGVKLEQYRTWARLAVQCAEMIWTETGHGEDKKSYVAEFLNRMFNSKKTVLTEEQIQVLIEAAVRELQERGGKHMGKAGG